MYICQHTVFYVNLSRKRNGFCFSWKSRILTYDFVSVFVSYKETKYTQKM